MAAQIRYLAEAGWSFHQHSYMSAPDTTERPRQIRVLKLAIGLILIEAGLVLIGYISPAMRALLRPVYFVVALVFAIAIIHGARGRNGDDRRQEERRHGDG